MANVNAYLSFNGNCEQAFNFYKSAFGGEFTYVGRYKDMPMPPDKKLPDSEKEYIMHVELPIGDGTAIYGADMSSVFGKVTAGDSIAMCVNVSSEEEGKHIYKKLSEGGKIIMPLEKTFWADLYGQFTDKFGVQWMINLSKK